MKCYGFLDILALITSPSLWVVKDSKTICVQEGIYFFTFSYAVTYRQLETSNAVYSPMIHTWFLLLPFIWWLRVMLVFRKGS